MASLGEKTGPLRLKLRGGGRKVQIQGGQVDVAFGPPSLDLARMFIAKQLLGALLSPLPLLLLGLAGAWLLLGSERYRTVGRWGMALGLLLLWALGTTPVADALLRPFEHRVPALLDPSDLLGPSHLTDPLHPRGAGAEAPWIVVLGSGHRTDARYPPTTHLSQASLGRVVEGVRLHAQLPGSRLLFTGWGGSDPRSSAQASGEAARALGVDPDRIEVEPGPRDTREEAAAVAARLRREGGGSPPLLLVTSGSHMPRALLHFQREGLHPLPAPTDIHTLRREGRGRLLPSAGNYQKVERATHEFLGLLWARLGGR